MGVTRTLSRISVIAAVLAAAWAYFIEPNFYTVRREVIARPNQKLLRILHLSDLHLTRKTAGLQNWLRTLEAEDPDLVVLTGDLISEAAAIDPLLDALEPLFDRPGVFVLGSNDYFAPVLKNPAKYLKSDDGERNHGAELPWQDLVSVLEARGWVNLTNTQIMLEIDGIKLQIKGVDDPHLNRDDFSAISDSYHGADFNLAIAHAPYIRVLDNFTDLGAQLLLAGHTHGGQLRVPGYGALVTNCDLDTKRARGLHPHSSKAGNTSLLNVSAGLGANPFTPVRFACRPEAVMLTVGVDSLT